MNHVAKLRFADGVERELQVPEGESLLGAALAEGVNLQHQCLSGSCGSCIGRLKCGEVGQKAGRILGLLPFEIEEGFRLACTSVPATDTVWDFDYESTVLDDSQTSQVEATVTRMDRVSETVVELTMTVDGEFSFHSGQYVRIILPDGTARSISLASTPEDLPKAMFLIRLVPDGVLSGYLENDCRVGDALRLEGPFGQFVLPEHVGPSIFIAGGTGLAPILSMLDHIQSAGQARDPMLLCFGISRESDFFYDYEFELRREWMPNLSVRLACDDLGQDSQLKNVNHGSVVSLLQEGDVVPSTKAFVCGPPGMVAAVTARLQELGLPVANIITERFNPS